MFSTLKNKFKKTLFLKKRYIKNLILQKQSFNKVYFLNGIYKSKRVT